eukprot:TRINITY_DN17092_c0_g1_i2.p1 TRINITY_DN17092_c0_g1~~TRINITY_DN17092_c0_g1_i2.p1  ORF type:complete len:550 (+),score=130.28 TRINITY_DN17092_c0_g1_i2:99-1748(+)
MEEEKIPPPLTKTGPPHLSQVDKVALCAGGARGISVDVKGVAFLKDITTDSKQKVTALKCKVTHMGVSSDGSRAAMSTDRSEGAQLFDLQSVKACGMLANSVALDFVKRTLIERHTKSGAANDETETDQITQTAAQRFPNLKDTCCALTPMYCAVGYSEKVVVLWDIRLHPKPIALLEYSEPVSRVAISEDANTIAAVSSCSKVIAWTRKNSTAPWVEQRFDHMPPDEPSFLIITPDKSHVLVGMSKLNALSLIDGMRYELKTRKPRCATVQGDLIFVGCENGLIQCVRFGRSNSFLGAVHEDSAGVSTCVFREISMDTDSIHREIQSIAVTRDSLRVTTAMRVQNNLQYLQWDMGSAGKMQARCVALKCMRDNDGYPPAVLKHILSFVVPTPEPELRVGQIGSIMAVGMDRRIPCIVLRVQDPEADEPDQQRYLRILSLPLCGPVEEEMEDYVGRNIMVPASNIRVLSIHAMGKETEKQAAAREKAIRVAESLDPILHARANPDGEYSKNVVARALRATQLDVIEAHTLLKSKKVPNDKLDDVIPEEE